MIENLEIYLIYSSFNQNKHILVYTFLLILLIYKTQLNNYKYKRKEDPHKVAKEYCTRSC